MDHHPPACTTHRALVIRALGDDPPDAALERYATEVAECPDCRRALALHLGVHPGASEQADTTGVAGMAALLREVRSAPPRPRRIAVLTGAATAAAIAALAGWLWLRTAAPVPVPAPSPEIAAGPPIEQITAPRAVPDPVRPAPRPAAPVLDDAVAMVLPDDWPAPPFEDLRGARPKDVTATVRAAQLVLSGSPAVGRSMALTVVTSTPTSLAVCVDGPERGVVWRGAVDAGRTELTRGGRPVAFAFAAPGPYRFVVSASDAELAACADPIHVVEVEVAG